MALKEGIKGVNKVPLSSVYIEKNVNKKNVNNVNK